MSLHESQYSDIEMSVAKQVAKWLFSCSDTTSQPKHQMESRLLLDVIVRKGTAVLELFACKNQPLLVWRDTFLVLDLGFHIVDCIRAFDFKGNHLPCESLDKNLHTTSQPKDQMERRLLLNVVIGQSTTILKLFTGKDQPLLVWWDPFLVLNLGLNIVNSVRALNFQSNGLSCESLDKICKPPLKRSTK